MIKRIKHFEIAFDELKDKIDDKITFANLINIITKSIEVVDKYKDLNGMEKKDLVLKLVCSIIEHFEKDEEVKKSLIDLTNTIGHNLIDAIIFATKGKLAVNIKNKLSKLNCCVVKEDAIKE
jgi:hypothetical protein